MIYEWLAQHKGAIFNFRKWQRRFLTFSHFCLCDIQVPALMFVNFVNFS